jgi:delta24-sterol reductase
MVFAGIALFVSLLVGVVIYAGSAEAPLASGFPWQFRLAAKLRTPILVFVVVPLSFLMRQYRWITRHVRQLREGAGDARTAARHEAHVADIVRQIKQWNSAGRPQLLRTAKPNWAAMSTKLGSNKASCSLIKVTHMRDVLHIDREALTVRVEPGATMGQLSEELLPLGMMLQTHIEMESISVGGCVMGFGIETNSHRYGFFQESIREIEFVDASGTLRSVTPDSDPELFFALPWSHGSIGFLTAVTLQLIQCKPYVRMEYEPTSTAEELTRRLRELAEAGPAAPDFLEATLYSADHAVIQAGYFEARPSAKVNPINRWYKPFFFRHVETALQAGAFKESLPLFHFLHRFSRSIFWEIEDMIPFSNHPVYRCLWGWLGAPEVSLLKLFQGPVIRRASVQVRAPFMGKNRLGVAQPISHTTTTALLDCLVVRPLEG